MNYGDRINESSWLYRVFCNRCGEPMRVEKTGLYSNVTHKIPKEHFCELCSPAHQGVGNGFPSWDVDAYAPCWKYGN